MISYKIISSLNDNKQAYLDYIDWLNVHGNRMNYLHSTVRTNFENLDSTLYKVTYDIKTRVNIENELQIKHFYSEEVLAFKEKQLKLSELLMKTLELK